METIAAINQQLHAIVWGPSMVALLLLTGVYFTVGTGFFQLRRMGLWLRHTLFAIFFSREVHRHSDTAAAISQFQALSTALAGTIGTGNIVGVAAAIVSGGPGAVFWMWVSGIFGMMTKYAENLLGNYYRYRGADGNWIGGPMVYIERGLHCRWLAVLFAFFCLISTFGIGNLAQANSIAGALQTSTGLAPAACGILLTLCTGLVILGGIRRIAAVAERFVPAMALFYLLGSGILLWQYRQQLPRAFAEIFSHAFGMQAVGGGVGGYAMMRAIQLGVARSIASNEAGLGSSVIVNSTSNVREPVQQGMWGIFEVFITTLVVCTVTALVILTTGVHHSGTQGAMLAVEAFSCGFGRFGGIFVSVAIICFAFSSILGWSYYGESAIRYLSNRKLLNVYKIAFIGTTMLGCVAQLDLVWSISDTFNGFMALPNVIAILALSSKVFHLTRAYLQQHEF